MTSVIWVSYTSNKDQLNPKYKSFTIIDDDKQIYTPRMVKETILNLFKLDLKLNVRLRRENGNILPINQYLPINRKKTAYKLEVFLPVIHKRTLSKYQDLSVQELRLTTAFAHKNIINYYLERICKLENLYQSNFQNLIQKFKKDIDQIEERIEFIDKRISESDNKRWSGIFRRPILW